MIFPTPWGTFRCRAVIWLALATTFCSANECRGNECTVEYDTSVAGQLIPKADGSGRRAAIEVLLNTPLASDLIEKGEIHKLKELMKRSREHGMITFSLTRFLSV